MSAKRNSQKDPHIYVFSGGKGLPTHSIVKSILVQFPDNKIPIKIMPDIQDVESLEKGIRKVWRNGGFIVHSMVDRKIRELLVDRCREYGIREFDMVGNLFIYLSSLLKQEPLNEPGLFRKMNLEYIDRIEAIEYTISSDDGLNSKSICDADVVLTGISRTGKTPTSMYMAMLGWKVANVPLVQGIEPPKELFLVEPERVFGLDISTNRLVTHRKKRLSDFGYDESTPYIDPRTIRSELDYAMSVFRRGGFSVIKVTNKPIESVANEIIEILALRFDEQSRKRGERL